MFWVSGVSEVSGIRIAEYASGSPDTITVEHSYLFRFFEPLFIGGGYVAAKAAPEGTLRAHATRAEMLTVRNGNFLIAILLLYLLGFS